MYGFTNVSESDRLQRNEYFQLMKERSYTKENVTEKQKKKTAYGIEYILYTLIASRF